VRALLLFVAACGGSPAPAPQQPKPAPAAANEETFTGTITEINFGCAADASCDLTVDNAKHVHFGHDTRLEGPAVWGNTEEVFTLMETPNQGVGKRVEVFAAKTGTSYTLQGKATYYIKVLP
jgi:hypothetical protein